MKKTMLSNICSTFICLLFIIFLIVSPVWSAPGDDKGPSNSPAAKIVSDQENDKGPSGPDKLSGKSSPKKKVVKKAGTAAAAGVAGKKVKNNINGKTETEN